MVSPVPGLRPCRAGLSFTLNLPKPGELTLLTLLRGSHDAGERRFNGLLGSSLSTHRLARHVIDQFSCLHCSLPVLCEAS